VSERELQALANELDGAAVDPEQRLDRESFALLAREVWFHSEYRYWQFTPTQAGLQPFSQRLWEWLQNDGLTRDDIGALLRTVPEIQFVDRDDMMTLYRAAYDGPIMRWLMDVLEVRFALPLRDVFVGLYDAIESTWFCAITDSFDIAQFHHANHVAGKDQRPPWRVLKTFGDPLLIRAYMQKEGVERLVLLEDFVGSGTQVSGPLSFAGKMLPDWDILFVPLIITTDGLKRVRDAVISMPRVRIEPVFVIPAHVQVREQAAVNEPQFVSALRPIILKTFDRVKEPRPPDAEPLVEPFGFGKLGTLLVLHTNCPNNTVPLIWRRAPEWNALFPRVTRS
jgi:hypothetical protein